MVGSESLMYSSDFPHEVNAETCKRELLELFENKDLSEKAKDEILYGNALYFYDIK